MHIVRATGYQRMLFYDFVPVAGRDPVAGVAAPSVASASDTGADPEDGQPSEPARRPASTVLILQNSSGRLSVYA